MLKQGFKRRSSPKKVKSLFVLGSMVMIGIVGLIVHRQKQKVFSVWRRLIHVCSSLWICLFNNRWFVTSVIRISKSVRVAFVPALRPWQHLMAWITYLLKFLICLVDFWIIITYCLFTIVTICFFPELRFFLNT